MLKTTTDGKFTFYNVFQHFPQNPVIFYWILIMITDYISNKTVKWFFTE